MSARFLFVGDIHYEGISSYFPDNHLDLINDTLSQIWQYAHENAVTDVIIGGDIFDNPYPKDQSKKAFLRSLDKNLNYYIILGNHDFASSGENSLNLCKYFIEDLGLMENVKFFVTPQTVEIQGVKFDMLPFPQTKPLSESGSVCIGHFQVQGYVGDNGLKMKGGEAIDENHVWLLGHLHRQQGELYPGSIVQTKFGEPVAKFFFDCRSDGHQLKLRKIAINTPFKLIDLVVTKLEDLDYLEKDNCYRIYVPEHLDAMEIQSKVKGFNIWQIKGVAKQTITKQDIEQAQEFQAQYSPVDLTNEYEVLKSWLSDKSNCDLTEDQIEKAVKIVQDLKIS